MLGKWVPFLTAQRETSLGLPPMFSPLPKLPPRNKGSSDRNSDGVWKFLGEFCALFRLGGEIRQQPIKRSVYVVLGTVLCPEAVRGLQSG